MFRPSFPEAVMSHRSGPAALLALGCAGLLAALLATGCADRRGVVREDRTASAVGLGAQGVVRIETRSADVHLIASPDDTVRVVTARRVEASTDDAAEAVLAQIKVTMERQGDLLVLRVREPERHNGRVNVQAGPWRIRRSVEIELTVAVPARARLECETARGDFDATGLAQDVAFVSTSGDVELHQGSGRVTVQTTSGDVTLRDLAGPASVRVTSGDVDAVDLTGGLALRATSGDVSASRVRGGARIETSTGDVAASEIAGAVFVSTSAGDVTLTANADSCGIETASGDVDARLSGAPRWVQVRTSSGEVGLAIPPRTGGALDLQTASGAIAVRTELDVDSMNRNRLTGRLGGPGSVAVRTSSGDITLSAEGVAP